MEHLSAKELQEIAEQTAVRATKEFERKLIIFAALICVATFLALGALTVWHAKLISRGETSVEARINSTESQKYEAKGKIYHNPYNFGRRENWKLFFGLNERRNWWHVVFPSTHKPIGTGLTWRTTREMKIS